MVFATACRYFCPPRATESEISTRDEDIAASAQLVLEERCYQLLDRLHRLTGLDSVRVSGGVALNCSMNGRIGENTPFRNVFVMPAANDAGLSIGAALWGSRMIEPGFRRTAIDHVYLGSEHHVYEIDAAVHAVPPGVVVEKPVDLVDSGSRPAWRLAIVGWYQGRMEFGPRALGHRSILANPTRADTKDIVNAKVKFREMFRPFAPVVPVEAAAEYFDPACSNPFMLQVVSVLPDKRAVIPAVTHVDGSARVQTVTAGRKPRHSSSPMGDESAQRGPGAAEHELQRPRRHHRPNPGGRHEVLSRDRHGCARHRSLSVAQEQRRPCPMNIHADYHVYLRRSLCTANEMTAVATLKAASHIALEEVGLINQLHPVTDLEIFREGRDEISAADGPHPGKVSTPPKSTCWTRKARFRTGPRSATQVDFVTLAPGHQ